MKTSISDYDEYKLACLEAALNEEAFKVFKKNPHYTTILEHTSPGLGQGYIDYIIRSGKFDYSKLEGIRKNDLQGGSTLIDYFPPFNQISPSTLRYTKVALELQELFGNLDGKNIVEIGGGYGGQCLVINEYFKPASYTLIDLKESMYLAQRYLRDTSYPNLQFYYSRYFPRSLEFDLVISNYAFSECEISMQNKYIEKIFKHSTHGYVTFNNISSIFGIESHTRESFQEAFPCKSKPEIPVSGDNVIFYW